MRTLTIERSKWRRGKGSDSWLLASFDPLDNSKEGMMCCLGFDCIARGLRPEDIQSKGDPEDLALGNWKHKVWNSADGEFQDRYNVPDNAREYFLDLFEIEVSKVTGDEKLVPKKAELINEAIKINDDMAMIEEDREEKLIPLLKQIGNYDEVVFVD